MRILFFNVFLIISIFLLSACSKSDNFSVVGMVGMQNPPVITGIRMTTNEDMEGYQGIVFGNPSYPMKGSKFERINVFPNPYYAFNPEEPSRFERFVTFTHLPREVTIEIYRGIAPGVKSNTQEIKNGAFILEIITPIQKIEKNSDSQFLNWDLVHEDGSYVPSGLYRAYFFTESDGVINWVDMYILNRLDCGTWIDPTGWLREDWSLVTLPNGEVFDLCQ